MNVLISDDKFQHHTDNWSIKCDNASGGSPRNVLEKCRRVSSSFSYDLVICFIDLDKFKDDYQDNKWIKEKKKLEDEIQNLINQTI